MSKKRVLQVSVVAIFLALILGVGIWSYDKNQVDTQDGEKTVTLEVESLRDEYFDTQEIETDEEFLGELLRELDYCEWTESEYGIYVTGFWDMREDTGNQYWWCLEIDGENSTKGADEVPLEDGETYSFVLKQGW